MDVTRALADKLISPGDSHWHHLWHCSPCFSEFKQLRDARLTRESRQRRIYLATAAAVLVMTILSGVIYRAVAEHNPPRLSQRAQSGITRVDERTGLEVLDYRKAASRGLSPELASKEQTVTLSAQRIEILLPNLSAAGSYVVEVREQSSLRVLKNFRGIAAAGVDGVPRLRFAVDFRGFQPGRYLLAWQEIGSDSWDYGPFSIRKDNA